MIEHQSLHAARARTLLEALEQLAAADLARSIVERALGTAGHRSVPEDPASFELFVEGHLRRVVVATLGASAHDRLLEELRRTVPGLELRAPGAQERPTEPPRSVSAPVLRANVPITAGRSAPPIRVREEGSGEQLLRRSSRAPVRAPSELPRPATLTLVLTLDLGLVIDTEARLRDRCRVLSPGSLDELRALAETTDELLLVVDVALSPISAAEIASLRLGSGVKVVLWGATGAQRARLVTLFPAAAAWQLRSTAESPADIVLGP